MGPMLARWTLYAGPAIAASVGFGSIVVAQATQSLPSAGPGGVSGGTWIVGIGGLIMSATPLVVKILEARQLQRQLDECRSEHAAELVELKAMNEAAIAQLRDRLAEAQAENGQLRYAVWVDRRFMLEAVNKHPDLVLPPGFGERPFDPKGPPTPGLGLGEPRAGNPERHQPPPAGPAGAGPP
jgi:hypothetical protein